MFRDLLERAGVEALVLNENAQGGMGEIPFTHAYPELWLRAPEDESRARAILRGIERDSERPERRCEACGELNPGAFDLCWHCGAAMGPAGAD